jgi:hypothetical protein
MLYLSQVVAVEQQTMAVAVVEEVIYVLLQYQFQDLFQLQSVVVEQVNLHQQIQVELQEVIQQ